MYWHLLGRSFNRNWYRKAWLIATVAVGSTLATAVLNLSLDVGDKINRELKRYGANIIVEPVATGLGEGGEQHAYLKEADLPQIKTIFWGNNILAFAPFLTGRTDIGTQQAVPLVGTWFREEVQLPTGETYTTGLAALRDWWRVDGGWPSRPDEVLVGKGLAQQAGLSPGQEVRLSLSDGSTPAVRVAGLVDSGGPEDQWVLAPLSVVQQWTGQEGRVERVEVSALTTPENQLARLAARDPQALSTDAFETWYCTAFSGSIAYQIEEVVPMSRARAVQAVSRAEGAILNRLQVLMAFLAVLALVSAGLGIANLMQAKVQERRQELGLMRALGASRTGVASLFLGEAVAEGALGGLVGYLLGVALAWGIGRAAFGLAIQTRLEVLPLVLCLAVLLTLGSSLAALSQLLRLQPDRVLRGG